MSDDNFLDELIADEGVWTTIDHNAPAEELRHTITQSIIASLKISHPDDMHFYVLEKVLNPSHHEDENKVWQRVLEEIQKGE